MKVFSFLEHREVKLNQVFSNTQSSNVSDDLSTCFRKMCCIYEKKIKAWWDIASFEQYIKCKLVPRRLRWNLPPNDGPTDDESIQEWHDFFDKKIQELIDFLLLRKQRKMTILDKQIGELKSKIEPLQNSPDFSRLSGELKNEMMKWDKEIQEKKKNKYIRDSDDYSKGDVFKWQSRVQILEPVPTIVPTQFTSTRPLPGTPTTHSQSSKPQGAIPKSYVHPNNRGRGHSSRGGNGRGNQHQNATSYHPGYREDTRGPPRFFRGRNPVIHLIGASIHTMIVIIMIISMIGHLYQFRIDSPPLTSLAV